MAALPPLRTSAEVGAELQRVRDELCRRDFRRFVKAAIAEAPGELKLAGSIQWTWYLDAIAEHLEAWARGDIRRLIINVKNKSWKSGLASILLPAWSWLWDPTLQWFTGGHAMSLAIEHCRQTRDVIRSDFYQRLAHKGEDPKWTLRDDQDAKSYYVNTKGGHRYAAWPPAGTGAGGSRFMIDDPLGIHDSYSDVRSEEANRWVLNTVMSRMNNPATDCLCVVQHRLRRDDTTGKLLERFPGEFVVLSLPLEYDPKRTMVVGAVPNPLGFEDPRTEPGESLDPNRWGSEVIETEKASQNVLYQALSNQDPRATRARPIKAEWIRRWSSLPAKFERVVQSWDLSFKGLDPTTAAARRKSEKRSKCCGSVWGFVGGSAYLLDLDLRHMDYIEQKDAVRDMFERWPDTAACFVEDEANGSALCLELSTEFPGIVPVHPGKKGGKFQRLAAVSHFFRAGNVYVPDSHVTDWADAFVTTLCDFPEVDYDEEVDVTSQVLSEEWLPKDAAEETEAQKAQSLLGMIAAV